MVSSVLTTFYLLRLSSNFARECVWKCFFFVVVVCLLCLFWSERNSFGIEHTVNTNRLKYNIFASMCTDCRENKRKFLCFFYHQISLCHRDSRSIRVRYSCERLPNERTKQQKLDNNKKSALQTNFHVHHFRNYTFSGINNLHENKKKNMWVSIDVECFGIDIQFALEQRSEK